MCTWYSSGSSCGYFCRLHTATASWSCLQLSCRGDARTVSQYGVTAWRLQTQTHSQGVNPFLNERRPRGLDHYSSLNIFFSHVLVKCVSSSLNLFFLSVSEKLPSCQHHNIRSINVTDDTEGSNGNMLQHKRYCMFYIKTTAVTSVSACPSRTCSSS